MSSALDHALSDRPDYGFANLSHFLFDEMNFTSTQAADLLLSAARQIRRPAYCEGKRGGLFRGYVLPEVDADGLFPEYGNVLSALAMMIVGFHMLVFWWTNEMPIHKLIAALFVVNAIGSMMVHATGIMAWQRFDGNTMILLVWVNMGYNLDEFWGALISKRWEQMNGAAVRAAYKQQSTLLKGYRNQRRLGMAIVWSLSLFMVFWINDTNGMTLDRFAEAGWGVDIGLLSLALPMAILIVLSFCMFRRQLVENAYVDHEHSERARRRFRFGVCLSAFGIASWIGVESGCAVSAFFVWYPGHVVFHVLISVGVTNMLLFAALLRADDARMHARIAYDPPTGWCVIEGDGCCGWAVHGFVRAYFQVLPRIVFEPLDSPSGVEEAELDLAVQLPSSPGGGSTAPARALCQSTTPSEQGRPKAHGEI